MAMNDDNVFSAHSLLQYRRESEDGKFSYLLLPNTRLEEAIQLLNVAFYPFENVSICTQVAQNSRAVTELNKLVRECTKDGVSIIAVDKATDQIVGISINKIQKKCADPEEPSFFEKFVQTRCKENESIGLIQLMIECDAHMNVFDHYNTAEVMEVMFLAVSPDYRRNNIGLELVRSSLLLAGELCARFNGPEVVVSLFASEYSKRIGQKLNFETLKMFPYDQFAYEGVKYSDTLPPEHTGIYCMAKRSV